jgi:hypothetical protein
MNTPWGTRSIALAYALGELFVPETVGSMDSFF